MGDRRISLTIMEVCQKLGIGYLPCNPKYAHLIDDAKRLGDIFRDLKILAGDLEAISERHQIDGLKDIIHTEALELEKIDHEIAKIAQHIKKQSC